MVHTIKYPPEFSNNVHVYPIDDDHLCDEICWCEPVINYINPFTGQKVFIHRKTLNNRRVKK